MVYRYEDNPSEYKKARKRIQNRESAHRVRNRKKDYYEDLHSELVVVKSENENLKVKNASLTAENNLLKLQITFLEKMVLKGQNSNEMRPEDQEKSLLPISKDDQVPNQSKFFRPAPPHTFKKHVAIFGIVTILICTVGVFSSGAIQAGTNMPAMTEFRAKIGFALKGLEEPEQMESMMSKFMEQLNQYNETKSILWYLMWTGYTLYLIYVLTIANWGYLFKNKKKIA